MPTILTATDLEDMARNAYHDSLNTGTPLTPQELADQYGRTEAWAIQRIREAQTTPNPAPTLDPEPATPNGHTSNPPPPKTTTPTTTTPAVTTTPVTGADTRQPEMVAHRRGAWLVSWTAFFSGTIVSIAANVMHAVVVNDSAPAWISAFWPIALLLAIEVLTRVHWPHGFWYGLARYGGTGLVAAVAAIVSYRHMSGLLTVWGEDTFNARIGPLAVDGLMIVAGVALLAMSKSRGAH